MRLCGVVGSGTYTFSSNGNHYMCVFCITQPAGVNLSNTGWFVGTSCFINTLVAISFTGPDLVAGSATNIFINSIVNIYKGMNLSLSNWRFYDFSVPLFNIQSRSSVGIETAIVGTGNTGKLVSVSSGSYLTGAANITAATSDALPWQVAGNSYATPVIDVNSGDGIY